MRYAGEIQGWGFALLAAVGFMASAHAQLLDPVDRLRTALKSDAGAAERNQDVRECLENLRTLSDLSRAYLLSEWRDRSADSIHAEVDQVTRTSVAQRYAQAAREILRGKDERRIVSVLDQIADLASTIRSRGEDPRRWWSQEFPRLARQESARVRSAAARAVGQTDPPLEVAVPVLAALLKADEPAVRLAAADGLTTILDTSVQRAIREDGPPPIEARQRLIATAQVILPALAPGLGDWHVSVRRRCVRTMGQFAFTIGRMLPTRLDPTKPPPIVDLGELLPLIVTLRAQTPGLARALRDTDSQVRLLAQKAFEEMAIARQRWLQAGQSGDPLLEALLAALPVIAEAIGDPEVRVRRPAIDVLEPLGSAAAPAMSALIGALDDRDRFVRWSAVRALGSIGPAARPATNALTALLRDRDRDLRFAAANALARINPAGRPPNNTAPIREMVFRTPAPDANAALPALLRGLKATEADSRLKAVHALARMGVAARPAIPALRETLHDPNPRVRQATATALGRLGALAIEAIDDLRVLVADSDAEVRRAAGDALIAIYRSN